MSATKLMQTSSRADGNRLDRCAVCWMEHDGHEVSGAAAELVALVNYMTSFQVPMWDP